MVDDLAPSLRIYLIFESVGLGFVCGDGLSVPLKGLTYVFDTGLDNMTLRCDGDLIVDDRVTCIAFIMLVSRVVINHTRFVDRLVEIAFTVDDRISVLADRDPFCTSRSGYDGEVQTIDTIGSVDAFQRIFVLFGLTDRVLQGLTAP